MQIYNKKNNNKSNTLIHVQMCGEPIRNSVQFPIITTYNNLFFFLHDRVFGLIFITHLFLAAFERRTQQQ